MFFSYAMDSRKR